MKRSLALLAALTLTFPSAQGADDALKATPEFEEMMNQGKAVFMTNCMACHQMTGAGLPLVAPALAGSDWLDDDDRIIRIVLHGMVGEIAVNGIKFNGAMVPYGVPTFPLDDKQVALVLSYVRNSWGNSGPLISPRRVARVREATKDRTVPYQAAEILEAHPLKAK